MGASDPIQLDRGQRDAIHAELVLQVSEVSRIADAVQDERWEHARELRERYVGFMRLLDDIGWARDPGDADVFDVTIPIAWLTRVVLHLQAVARRRVTIDKPAPSETSTVLAAYEELLDQMSERVEAGADAEGVVSIYADELVWCEWGRPRNWTGTHDESGGGDV